MKAIILAAGKATRLLPLTKETPQCLLKLHGRTILEYQVEALNKAGVEDITVITGYLSDKVEQFCRQKRIRYSFNPFYSVSGMLMSLWVIKEILKDEFILLYSDILFEESIIKYLLNNQHDICLATKKGMVREEAEKVIIKSERIAKISKTIIKKEETDIEFIGIAKFSRKGAHILISLIDEIAKDQLNAHFIDAVQKLIDEGNNVYSCDVGKAKWIDIDFEKDLKIAEKLFSK